MQTSAQNTKQIVAQPLLNKWLEQGETLRKSRQFKDALKYYEKAIETEPLNAQAWRGKAECQIMGLLYTESIATCEKAIELDPKNASIFFLKSFAHGVLGEYEKALESTDGGLQLDSSNKMIWCSRGQYLYALGRLEESLESFGTALKMNPDSQYCKDVTEKVKKWLQRDGQGDEWVNKVMSFLQEGGYKEALDTYKESLKVNPRNTVKSFEKDYALAHLENPEKILKQFEKSKVQDQPALQIELSQKEFEFSRESWVEVTISNKGKTTARDLMFHFSPEVVVKFLDVSAELLQQQKMLDKPINLDAIPELLPGTQIKKLVSLMPTKVGQVSLEVTLDYIDTWQVKQTKSTFLWISVFKPNEQLPTIPGHKLLWRLSSSEAATIYIAQRSLDGTRVVIKIPRFTSEQTALANEYLNEIKQCSKLIQPNIIRIFQADDNPSPWIAIEYMPKGNLTRRIDILTITQSLLIGISLADAIAYARTVRITHRSICPDNVLFDSKDIPKLINWRVGTITQKLRGNTNISETVTAYYAPEKLATGFGGIDWLTDIYQFGAMLYEMTTHKPPFTCKGEELIQAILNTSPAKPSSINPDITTELDCLIMGCLAKNKKDRFQSITLVKNELEKLINLYKKQPK